MVMFHKTLGSSMELQLDHGRYGKGAMPFKVMDLFILLDAIERSKEQSQEEKRDTFLRVLEDVFSSPGISNPFPCQWMLQVFC